MPHCVRLFVCLFAASALAVPATPAFAISPQNPYRSFNLSGVNYGSMQWERAQRQGKRVWPYYNTPSRSYSGSRNGVVTAGGFVGGGGGAIIQGSGYRSSPRVYRRSRR
jgi:hypothetical protein